MCGIAGFLSPTRPANPPAMKEIARRMGHTLIHRGPDDGDEWVDAVAGVALAHRRLSILDLSPHGHQPMSSADGRYVIAFNGEIYNHAELAEELRRRGHHFRGHSDTEVMLGAFLEWGVAAALQRFNGMFAFALWDRTERLLYLSRDRMGEKPLYYGWMGGTFAFASELKALRVHRDFDGSVSREALALFLRHNYVPTPYSIYTGIKKLEPGVLAAVSPNRPGEVATSSYWSLDEVVRARSPLWSGDPEDAVDAVESLLRDAVRLRMHADVPLGAFLSGGIDSSTVVALMQAQSSRPVRTFTIGFSEAGYDEAGDAKRVAAHLGTDHTELYLSPQDALDVIPRIPELYDEPFADSSQVPTFLVSRLARQHVTVSLSGDGGDELFGGYVRYLFGAAVWRKIGWIPAPVRRGVGWMLQRFHPRSVDRGYARVAGMLPRSLKVTNPSNKVAKLAEMLRAGTADGMYRSLVSHWSEPSAIVTGATEPATVIGDPTAAPGLRDIRERMMFLDAVTYLPDDILAKIDRASMGVSLEARVPMLDHRLVELAWRLPLEVKIRQGETKWALRQVLYRYVPRDLIERPKMGFGVPIDSWLRGPLREWAQDLLGEGRLRAEGFFDPAPIRLKLDEHLSGKRNHQYLLWDVLMFQAWLAAHRPA